jgi:hypothetical protein
MATSNPDKKVTLNINGMELKPPAPTKSYPMLLTGLLVAASIILHAWLTRHISPPTTNISVPAAKVQVVPVEVPQKTPWEDRLVKKYSISN